MISDKIILTNVQFGKKKTPPITLVHLASQIKNTPIEIVDSQGISPADQRDKILNSKADIICISFMTNESKKAYDFTKFLKMKGIMYIIHGGIHPTMFPDASINSGADFVISGEADKIFPQLINNLRNGQIPEIKIIKPSLPDLSSLSSVDWSNISLTGYSSYFIRDVQIPLFSSRGCVGRCRCLSSKLSPKLKLSFCNNIF